MRRLSPFFVGLLVLCGMLLSAPCSWAASTYYVWTNSPVNGPGTDWSTAFHVIQDAIDLTKDGDTIRVTNGIYSCGGAVAPSSNVTNRIVATNAILIQSETGPQDTIILGQGPIGSSAVRCAFLTDGAVLSGFTLSNGHTMANFTWADSTGGGAFALPYEYFTTGGFLTNCLIVCNTSSMVSGGVVGGTLYACTVKSNTGPYGAVGFSVCHNCTISENTSTPGGFAGGTYATTSYDCRISNNWGCAVGGAYAGTLSNCWICGNTGILAGGTAYSTLYNCTVSGNVSADWGAGAENSTLYDYIVSGNSASNWGGGAYMSTLIVCRVTGNYAGKSGGGACSSTLYNCIVAGNVAPQGGGTVVSTIHNCTVVSNTATSSGGGVYNGSADNSIIYYNSAPIDINFYQVTLQYSCTTPDPGGTGNITNEPRFVDSANGNLRLSTNSACIDVGMNAAWMTNSADLDGNLRIVNYVVDMGAYEATNGIVTNMTRNGISWDWLIHFGLAFDGSIDTNLAANRQMNNLEAYIAGTDPTNIASVFQIDQFYLTGTSLVVSWPSVARRIYDVEQSPSLMPANWTPVPSGTNILGFNGRLDCTNVIACTNDFYRLKVRLVP